ncbi:MAG: TRAP transporter substrate-binding protein DctP [Candidatus Tectomicrobia bacterium]|uniref:TRAP transporter substrate-binding protein DctP n=1 Tax=Tectimicrobiota bacterium TaxID=2528274 RepID=A0A932HYK8_UNCTE|nr:TRAP transporter substrate-binding protein DctP [Candidatus Tectomicrobia bacterium]
MRRLILLAAVLLAAAAHAQPALRLGFPKMDEIAQCGRLLAGAKEGPFRLEPDPLYQGLLSNGVLAKAQTEGRTLAIALAGFFRLGQTKLGEIARPFIFRDLAHFRAFARSPLFEEEGAKFPGLRPLALAYAGTTYPMSKKPLREPRDMGGLKLGSGGSDLKAWKTYRVMVPLNRMGGALKSGLVDAVLATPIHAVRLGLADAAPYFNRIEIQHQALAIAVSNDVWDGLAPKERQSLVAWARGMADRCSAQTYEAETRAIEALKKQGVTIVEPNQRAFESQRPDPAEGAGSEEGKAFIRKVQAIR